MPTYSVIIPTYNSAPTLGALLTSLEGQTLSDFEVIVVDDASTDDTPGVANRHQCRYIRLEENRGPAHARNLGAAKSSGEWLVYTDADTEFTPDTLAQIDRVLGQCEADALVGTYAGEPANRGFAPRYKALWEYCIIDRRLLVDKNGVMATDAWAPRPGVVRRAAFEAVGGFKTSFTGADLEDVEFGYRLSAAGYRIMLAPNVRIRHHYPATVMKEMRAFARRVAIWMRMLTTRRKLDKHGEGTPQQALAHVLGFGAFLLLVAGIAWWPLGVLGTVTALVYFAANGAFIAAAWKTGGAGFALRAALYCWLHSIVMGFAAAYGLLTPKKGMEPHGG